MVGLREDSLYYTAYFRLRQPLIDLMFEGVRWDDKTAVEIGDKLKVRKDEIKDELDSYTRDDPLYVIHRHRSRELIDLLAKQREIREAKKGLGRSERNRELKRDLDEIQRLIKDCRESGRAVDLERGEGLSDQRIGAFLYEGLGLKKRWKRRDGGKMTVTVDDNALRKIAMEEPKWLKLITLIREHRRCEKLVSTYLNPSKMLSPLTGRFHSHYKTFGTQSGRLSSSSDPWGFGGNAQNQDRQYKWLFLPDEDS